MKKYKIFELKYANGYDQVRLVLAVFASIFRACIFSSFLILCYYFTSQKAREISSKIRETQKILPKLQSDQAITITGIDKNSNLNVCQSSQYTLKTYICLK